MRHVAWLLPLLALLAPPALAAGHAFSASTIALGWSDLDGTAPFLAFEDDADGHRFTLDAATARLETDSIRLVQAGETGVGTRPPRTDTLHYGPSTWSGESGTQSSLFILPQEGATVQTSAGSGLMDAATVACRQLPGYFVHRPPPCPDVTDAVRLVGSASTWTVIGNFTLVLWSWEGTVQGARGTEGFWTGSQATQSNLAGRGEVELRQAFIVATDAILRLEAASGAPVEAHATSWAFTTDGAATLVGSGSLQALEGGAYARVGRDGAGLRGESSEAGLAPSSQAATVLPSWSLGALGALALTAPATIILHRRNAGRAHLDLADQNLERGNFGAAARHANRARRHARWRDQACVIGTVACLRQDDLVGAQDFLAALHTHRGHDEAACRFLMANLRIRQGRPAEGERLLEDCLAIEPSYRARAAANDVLAPFLDPTQWPGAH